MDYRAVLKKSKFFFDWGNQEDSPELEVYDLNPDKLFFSQEFTSTLQPPKVTVSIKLRHRWYDHVFEETQWIIDDDGKVFGLTLKGGENSQEDLLKEWKKNLELGLCV